MHARFFAPATLFLLAAALCSATPPDLYAGPTPLAVLLYSSVWYSPVAETPKAIIYDDGTAIVETVVDDEVRFNRILLGAGEFVEVRGRIGWVLDLPNPRPRYDVAPGVHDLATALLYATDGRRERIIQVYGLTEPPREMPKPPRGKNVTSGYIEPIIPAQDILGLHQWLATLEGDRGTLWTPRYVEAVFWNAARAESSVQWPTNWPAPESERAVQTDDGFSIFLDGTMMSEVHKLLRGRFAYFTVDVNHKPMHAWCRPTFPHEPVWRNAFDASRQRAIETWRSELAPSGALSQPPIAPSLAN